MKQTFAVIILVIVVLGGGIYLLTPTSNTIEIVKKLNVTQSVAQRMFAANFYRKKWLPKEGKIISEKIFLLDDCSFDFTNDLLLNTVITVKYKNKTSTSFLNSMAVEQHSIVSLNFNLPKSKTVFERGSNYFTTRHLKKTTEKMFSALKIFTDDMANVYGVKMQKTLLKDSTLIAVKAFVNHYPTISEIYSKISLLQQYARESNSIQTNPPMLNIYKQNDSAYNFMVALPINKFLQDKDDILGKRMLAGGNILETGEITGGNKTVEGYLIELENFRADNAAIAPAIPYQSLITDRSKESDTAKWITKLYFPVF